ncbi:oxidoreductase [Brucella tritici]|uniref:Ldh family oxidoreductase n=1 Tax=Brucella tritici TaxID=94626 RepID=UPI00124E122A|nr:Ldh family oxidoreductase [Brucella tritici]KAB2671376.1 oxidoreductase [Brucella tritici]
MIDDVRLPEKELLALAVDFLSSKGLNEPQVHSLAGMLIDAQRDGSRSHGLQRLPGTLDTMAHPQFNKNADPRPENVSPAFVRIDEQFGFSCLAAERGIVALIDNARHLGIALLAVKNGFHSTALWPLVERIAQAGLVGLSMNPTHSWVAPAGGTKGLLGTNPLAFAWPRHGKNPYVFDFATTAASRADIAIYRSAGKAIPDSWGVDTSGQPTTDPAEVLAGAMLPFGGHKGSAIATMIELLAGPMIGDRTSQMSKEFDQGADAAPCHSELFLAFSPEITGGTNVDAQAEKLFAGFAAQSARIPGERRHKIREQSSRDGIAVSKVLLERIQSLIA